LVRNVTGNSKNELLIFLGISKLFPKIRFGRKRIRSGIPEKPPKLLCLMGVELIKYQVE
jgi:hypothetical protein